MILENILDFLIYISTHLFVMLGIRKAPESLRCLTGKTAIVTGGNAGIGFAVATKLASRGCKVILADCVNAEPAVERIKQITGNSSIFYKHLDLSSLKSVRSFASDICRTEEKIDILLNNAGIGLTKKTVSEDGLNYLMQVNIFGAFLLTHLLLAPLKKSGSAQVIFTSSIAVFKHSLTLSRLNPTDFEMNDSYIVSLYSNSKACNILAAQEFGKRLKDDGITVNAIDPMGARTEIFNNLNYLEGSFWRNFMNISLLFIRLNIEEIANSYFYVMTKHQTDIPTGKNYVLSTIARKPKILHDKKFCAAVWSKMEELVNLRQEEKIVH